MPAAAGAPVRALIAGLLAVTFLLAGCGRTNPYSLPEYDEAKASSTASAAAAGADGTATTKPPTAPPSPQVLFRPADALGQGAWAERGEVNVDSRPERAVVKAIVKYLAVRVELSNTWVVDEKALAAVASGQAVTSARERAERQKDRGRRSIGRFVVNLSAVRVAGDRATATGCHFDATSEVDQDGNVLVAPPGGVLITMHLRRTGGTWRVLDWPERSVPSCDWRS